MRDLGAIRTCPSAESSMYPAPVASEERKPQSAAANTSTSSPAYVLLALGCRRWLTALRRRSRKALFFAVISRRANEIGRKGDPQVLPRFDSEQAIAVCSPATQI